MQDFIRNQLNIAMSSLKKPEQTTYSTLDAYTSDPLVESNNFSLLNLKVPVNNSVMYTSGAINVNPRSSHFSNFAN